MTTTFINTITLCGIVTEITKEHLGEGDLIVWRINMFTEHHYAVDDYHERSHFSVLVFPDVVGFNDTKNGIKKGDWITVVGRLRTAISQKGETFPEIVARTINLDVSIICLPE